MTANGSNDTVTLEIIRASEVTPREVKWLWYPYIPFGKITLLQGDPGDGKSKFMLALSALLTDGKPLPFQEAEEASGPMTVIYQTTEDDADDTVVPRFIASGGNRDNLIFIKENEKHLTFGDDRLQQAIERYNVKLLILDPLSSYIGEDCSMNDANKTRTELNHLIKIGQETDCAIVVVAHMNKNRDTSPLYRTNGSIDIAAAARSILAVARTQNKENLSERYMVQVKSNLAPTGNAIVFEVTDKGVNFHDEIELTADEAFFLFAPKLGRPSEKVDGAVAFLKELLSDGRPQLATECETKLEAAGFKKSTIKKAKKKAGVHSVKEGFLWYWALTVGEKPKEERQAVMADDGLPF